MIPALEEFRRVVIKVGSALLVDRSTGLKRDWLESLAADIGRLAQGGAEILVVSSGAIALGRTVLGRDGRRLDRWTVAIDRPPRRHRPVATMTDLPARDRLATDRPATDRVVRVSLGLASARADVPPILVEPDGEDDDHRARVLVDGQVAATYRLERSGPGRLAIVDDAAPEARIAAVNSDRILRESAPAKAAQTKLEAEFAKRDKDLQDMAQRLKTMSDSLDKSGTSMSASDRAQKQRDLS